MLSCGQLMAGRADCQVVTVFTGVPERGRMLTPFDKNCGFRSAMQAVRERKKEDEGAMLWLDAKDPVTLGFLDNQYRNDEDVSAAEPVLAERLGEAVDASRARVVVGPMGLSHPDHHITRRIYELVLRTRPELEAWVYEDLPSRVLWPEEVGDALAWWHGMGWTIELGFLGTGDEARKVGAVNQYKSQLWALNPHTYLVPERFHRLTR